MIRAVIDTNVLVSALISPSGNEALLLLGIAQGLVRPCFSSSMLTEYREVLARRKFSFPRNEVEALIKLMREKGEHFSPRRILGISPDPKDDQFIACAIAAQAQFIVTGNKKDFPECSSLLAEVVSAGELLNLIALKF